jgi:hypothetical protein
MASFYRDLPFTEGLLSLNGLTGTVSLIAGTGISITPSGNNLTISALGGGGSVTSFAFTNGGGFTGTVTNPTTTPTLSLTGTLSGDVTGSLTSTSLTATTNSTLTTLSSLSLPYSQLSGTVPTWNQNTTGSAASFTGSLIGDVTGTQGATVLSAVTNSTITTLSSLSLPFSQLTSVPAFGASSWKQTVTTASSLPSVGNTTGDARIAQDTQVLYIWSGSAWVAEDGLLGVTALNTLTGAVTLAAGTGITITPSGNTLTIASTGGGGSVTSVSGTNPITSSGGSTPAIGINQAILGCWSQLFG